MTRFVLSNSSNLTGGGGSRGTRWMIQLEVGDESRSERR